MQDCLQLKVFLFKVQLTYIYANKQADWLRPFLDKAESSTKVSIRFFSIIFPIQNPARDVLVIWRFEHVKAKFRWLTAAWDGDEGKMDQLIGDVIAQRLRLEHTAPVAEIVSTFKMQNKKTQPDEHAPSLWTKWTRAAVRLWENAFFHLTKEEAYPVISVLGTFVIILLLGYFMNYLNADTSPKKVINLIFQGIDDFRK